MPGMGASRGSHPQQREPGQQRLQGGGFERRLQDGCLWSGCSRSGCGTCNGSGCNHRLEVTGRINLNVEVLTIYKDVKSTNVLGFFRAVALGSISLPAFALAINSSRFFTSSKVSGFTSAEPGFAYFHSRNFLPVTG
jgi:hypothetical protein